MIKHRSTYILLLGCGMALTGCFHHGGECEEETSLGYDAIVKANYLLEWELQEKGSPDWSEDWPSDFGIPYDSLCPKEPDGLRCIEYSDDDDRPLVTNMPAKGGRAALTKGEHELTFINNDTERIIFDDLDEPYQATATTRPIYRDTYEKSAYYEPDQVTLTPPDELFVHFIADYESELGDTSNDTIHIVMHPRVVKYLVRFEFDEGIEYVKQSRGALSGMAESVRLYDGMHSSNKAAFLFDAEQKEWGVQAVVNTFGISDQIKPETILNLEVLLPNGKIKSFNFDVSGQTELQSMGGVLQVEHLKITRDEADTGAGAFDVSVEDWDVHEDVILDF